MRTFLFAMLGWLLFAPAQAQPDITDQVVVWLKTGNSKELSKHFIDNIDLTLNDVDDMYSRAQAEMMVSKFFNDHPPKEFVIRHEGKSKLDDYYRIGKLTTSNGIYRVTFFLKNDKGHFLIKQLRIEESTRDF